MLVPYLESWHPHFREILYPPLAGGRKLCVCVGGGDLLGATALVWFVCYCHG